MLITLFLSGLYHVNCVHWDTVCIFVHFLVPLFSLQSFCGCSLWAKNYSWIEDLDKYKFKALKDKWNIETPNIIRKKTASTEHGSSISGSTGMKFSLTWATMLTWNRWKSNTSLYLAESHCVLFFYLLKWIGSFQKWVRSHEMYEHKIVEHEQLTMDGQSNGIVMAQIWRKKCICISFLNVFIDAVSNQVQQRHS